MELQFKLEVLSRVLDYKIDIGKWHIRLKNCDKLQENYSINPKQIFFDFFIDETTEDVFVEPIIEQLEIVFQILINQGYKIFVSDLNLEEKHTEVCKNFVEVFKDNAIQYLGNAKEDEIDINIFLALHESKFSIVTDEQSLLYSLISDKPFISLFNNEELLEKIQLEDLFVNQENFNAGVLLEKIKYIEENNERIKEHILNIFGEHELDEHKTEEHRSGFTNNYSLADNSDTSHSHDSRENSQKSSQEKLDKLNGNIPDEMENYKKQFKENIKALVEQGLLKEAKDALKQYEEIIKDDIDIYSIRGIVAMMEGDLNEAEKLFDGGMLLDSNNEDLLYNAAYLYKVIGKIDKCNYLYKKLYDRTDNKEIKKEIEECIDLFEGNFKKTVLIGSPIHQKPLILKEFLQSLRELDKENLCVDYFFIDDNNFQESSELLNEFSKKETGVYIYRSQNNDEYLCDNNTHHWKEKLVWKVASFKDKIIKYAKTNNYDYLFFIDSDLVLNPKTLKHLVSTGKDIISEIFWTKWQPNSVELPQVWLKDTYTQYHVEREENLNRNEIINRHKEFIDKLKVPGVYEVGGLGACTLISKFAIDRGISFKEIKNLSFWGEDRHFCIRAVALGLSLYVDTCYPAYHIYRETDLCGVEKYRRFRTNINKKKIVLVYTNLSGSNTVALYKLADQNIRDKYDINLIPGDLSNESLSIISNSDVAIFTEGNYPFKLKCNDGSSIVIDLWHGFPMKAMGYTDKGEKFKDLIKGTWDNTDYITSYSLFFNRVMNRCISTDSSKYIITGAQRNDLLFCTDGRENAEFLFGENFENKKFIFFMPTYRYTPRGNKTEGNRNWRNIFGFQDFNMDEFSDFLEKNNIIFFIKLHPAEEKIFLDKIPTSKNIKVITNDMLSEKGIDLYEILNSANVLITDYSSVYFDMLLLDTPMMFMPVDLEKYEKDRGILLKPYEDWTPGPKCLEQNALHEEILKLLSDPGYYKLERKNILMKTHKYVDGNACARTWGFINKILEK